MGCSRTHPRETPQRESQRVTDREPRVRAEGEVNDTDARLWHPWLRINRILRVMLHTRWSACDCGARIARLTEGDDP